MAGRWLEVVHLLASVFEEDATSLLIFLKDRIRELKNGKHTERTGGWDLLPCKCCPLTGASRYLTPGRRSCGSAWSWYRKTCGPGVVYLGDVDFGFCLIV
jgi:hypothetical protein